MYPTATMLLVTPLFISVALAFPTMHTDLSHRMVVPENADRIAFDEITKRLVPFDAGGSRLGDYHMHASLPVKRAVDVEGSNCRLMTQEDLDTMPNLSILKDAIRNTYSEVKFTMRVNDPDVQVPNGGNIQADICIVDSYSRMTIQHNGEPQCGSDRTPVETSEGTPENSVTFSGLKVETPSQYFAGTDYDLHKVDLGVVDAPTDLMSKLSPKFEQGSVGLDLDFRFANVAGNDATVSWSEPSTPPGQNLGPNCNTFVESNWCSVSSTIELVVMARGSVVVEFEEKVSFGEGEKYTGWVFNMAGLISQKHRASSVILQGTGRVSSSQFKSEGC